MTTVISCVKLVSVQKTGTYRSFGTGINKNFSTSDACSIIHLLPLAPATDQEKRLSATVLKHPALQAPQYSPPPFQLSSTYCQKNTRRRSRTIVDHPKFPSPKDVEMRHHRQEKHQTSKAGVDLGFAWRVDSSSSSPFSPPTIIPPSLSSSFHGDPTGLRGLKPSSIHVGSAPTHTEVLQHRLLCLLCYLYCSGGRKGRGRVRREENRGRTELRWGLLNLGVRAAGQSICSRLVLWRHRRREGVRYIGMYTIVQASSSLWLICAKQ